MRIEKDLCSLQDFSAPDCLYKMIFEKKRKEKDYILIVLGIIGVLFYIFLNLFDVSIWIFVNIFMNIWGTKVFLLLLPVAFFLSVFFILGEGLLFYRMFHVKQRRVL